MPMQGPHHGERHGGMERETVGQPTSREPAEVAAVPGEAFGPSGYLRFSYALGDADIVEGVSRLQKLFG